MVLFKGSKTQDVSEVIKTNSGLLYLSLRSDQRLDLQKLKDDDHEPIRGQVVVSLLSKECSRNDSTRLQNIVIADHVQNLSSSPSISLSTPTIHHRSGSDQPVASCDRDLRRCSSDHSTKVNQPSRQASGSTSRLNTSTNEVTSPPVKHNITTNANQNVIQLPPRDSGASVVPPVVDRTRRSTRHRNYLSRNTLHSQVPAGSEPCLSGNRTNLRSVVTLPGGYEMRTSSQGQILIERIP